MFEKLKTAMKIRKFRKYNSVIKEFIPEKHIVQVQNGKTVVEVSFRLLYFDAMYIAFSGDGICADADCLTRLTELLWDKEFPLNFPKIQVDELVEQVRKARLMNLIPIDGNSEEKMVSDEIGKAETEQAEEPNEEYAEATVSTSNGAEDKKDELLQRELNRKIYFRDLHDWIMGNPNDVLVTLRVHKPIDR